MAIKPKPQPIAAPVQTPPPAQVAPAAQQTVTVQAAPQNVPAEPGRKPRQRKVQPPSQALPPGNALAEIKGSSALVPVTLSNLESMAHQGLEQANSSDFITPMLKVIKKHDSKEVDEVEGCEPGYLLLTSTKEMWTGDEGPNVIPCFYRTRYVEWRPRNQGGGIVADYPPTHQIVGTAVRQGNKDVLPNGNELQHTRQFFVLVETEQGFQPALINFTGGGHKIARAWLTAQTSVKLNGSRGAFTPPTYAMMYRAGSQQFANDNGKWFDFAFGQAVPLQDEGVFQQADAFYKAASGDLVKMQAEEPSDAPAAPSPAAAGFDDEGDEQDIPF